MRLPSENPYDFSHAVKDPELFAGRVNELRDIEYYLQQAKTSTQPVGLAVVGKRTSGKTSLLNMIEVRAHELDTFPVRVDLDETDVNTPLLFFHRVIEEILLAAFSAGFFGGIGGDLHRYYIGGDLGQSATGLPLMLPAQLSRAAHEKLLDMPVSTGVVVSDLHTLRREIGKPIVVIVDEADVIATQPTILQKLRNVLTRVEGIQFVIAGTDQLFPAFDQVFAPIARQFKSVLLDAFQDSRETADCILNPLRRAGLDPAAVFDRDTYDDLSEIHDLARGRPYEVKLICHFMFKRAQQGLTKRMTLDLQVLEEVRKQLESERNVGQRPILNTIRALGLEELNALAILVDCDGGATIEDIWAQEYTFHGSARTTQEHLRQSLEQFSAAGILHLVNSCVAFSGDDFDRLYVTYYARERKVELAFPPDVGLPLELYWSVNLKWNLRLRSIYALGPMRAGESRREIDNLALLELLNVLSGIVENPSLLERNEELTVDLHNLMMQARHHDDVLLYRIRVRFGSVDISQLFTGPGILDDADRPKSDEELRLIQIRLGEMRGSLEIEQFRLPIYKLTDIIRTIATHGSPRLRTELARTHAGMARSLYRRADDSHESLMHARLVVAYGADVFPSMANDVGYVLLANGDPRVATALLQQAVHGAEGDDLYEALANYNLAIGKAQLGDFNGAIDSLNDARELAQDLDEEDRAMLCLFVGSVIEGRLKFTEITKPDLLVAIVDTLAAVEHQNSVEP